jgi:hypothetical protein
MGALKATPEVVRRISFSLLIGTAVTSLAWFDTSNTKWLDTGAVALYFPGMFIGMVMGTGLHDPNWLAAQICTGVLWACLAYFFLRWRGNR